MLSELTIQEEYYRQGTWKIYYRLSTTPMRRESKRYDGTRSFIEIPCDEIKFSGRDAKERSHNIFDLMCKELVFGSKSIILIKQRMFASSLGIKASG